MQLEPSLGTPLSWKVLCLCHCKIFVLVFKYFSLYTGSLSNPFLSYSFIPHFIACFQQIFILNKKRYIFSFIKAFNTSAHFWKHYTQCFNIIIIFVSHKIFKISFIIWNLVRHHYFSDIYLVYINRILRFAKCTLSEFSIIKR